ncbi:MAG: TRAP transporter substrate-binding protein [Hyphomicrobiales bacterium]|nr:TRAP transporter substrate-binding protein [Hyphomicrobiales bacterium]
MNAKMSQTAKNFASGSAWKAAAAGALFVLSASFTPAQAEKILKFAPTVPTGNPTIKFAWQPWIDQVNKEAKGEFQIKVFGMSLANSRNVWERTVNGVTDIGFALNGTAGLSFDKTQVTSLPLLVKDGQAGASSEALWRLYEQGLLKDEYKNVRLIGLISLPVQGLAVKKPIAALADVKGLKIRVADRISGNIATALGGSPISLSATEVYQALSRGVVEGAIANWIMMGAFRLTEVSSHYVTGVPIGSPPAFVIMNPKSYASLSAKGKKIIDKFSGPVLSRQAGTALERLAHGARARVLKAGKFKVSKLEEKQAEEWRKALGGVVEKWAKDTANGRKVLDQYRIELKKAVAAK